MQSGTEPRGKLVLAHTARCNAFHHTDGVQRIKADFAAVIQQEETRSNPRDALVPIHERVIFRKSMRIGRCEVCGISVFIVGHVLRTGERTVERGRITKTVRTTVLGQLPVVNGVDH